MVPFQLKTTDKKGCFRDSIRRQIPKTKKRPDFTSGRLYFGGEGGIRTLETLLGFTRFPVVRPRPG